MAWLWLLSSTTPLRHVPLPPCSRTSLEAVLIPRKSSLEGVVVGLMSSVGGFAMEESRGVMWSNLVAIAAPWTIAAGFTAAVAPLAREVTAKRWHETDSLKEAGRDEVSRVLRRDDLRQLSHPLERLGLALLRRVEPTPLLQAIRSSRRRPALSKRTITTRTPVSIVRFDLSRGGRVSESA